MAKRMEKMTREEVLREFEGSPVSFRVGKRPGNPSVLAIRVHPDLKGRLEQEARKRGVKGHTTMARVLIEEGLNRSADKRIRNRGPRVIALALKKLREAEGEVERTAMAFASGR